MSRPVKLLGIASGDSGPRPTCRIGASTKLGEAPVIGWEPRVLLKHDRERGISRRTVYRWILAGDLDRDLDGETVRCRARPAVPRKIDPYRGTIRARLADLKMPGALEAPDPILPAVDGDGLTPAEAIEPSRRCSGPLPVRR